VKASKVLFLVFLSILSLCVVNTHPVRATENSWTTKALTPTPLSGGVAVANGKIYAIACNVTYEYDPATNTWTTKKPMPTPRWGFAIAAYQNKVYVIGGITSTDPRTGLGIYCSLNEVYDPLADTWESKTSMPTARAYFDANVVNGKIYHIGGFPNQPSPDYPLVSDVNEVYDPATDSWIAKAPIPTAVYGYASAVVNNKIYVISGQGVNRVNLNQIYDPEAGTWSYGAPIPTDVHYAAAGATTGVAAPKRIYVLGGNAHGAMDSCDLNQVYDPEGNTWTTGAQMPTPRRSFGVAVVNDVLYAIGGSTGWWGPLTAKNEQYLPFGFGTVPPDTTPPAISIVSPENKMYTVTDVPLTFTVSEPTSWMGYSLDGQANVTINGNTTLSGSPDGSHSLIVYAKDAAGNIGASETVYFSIKTELFLTTWIVAAIAIIAAVGAALLVYFAKVKKTTEKP